MKLITRRLKHTRSRKVYVVTFDQYSDIDTIQSEATGRLMSSTNSVCKSICRNADTLLHGGFPTGFEKPPHWSTAKPGVSLTKMPMPEWRDGQPCCKRCHEKDGAWTELHIGSTVYFDEGSSMYHCEPCGKKLQKKK